MSTSLGEAVLQIGADVSRLKSDFEGARRQSEGLLSGLGSMFKGAFSTALGFAIHDIGTKFAGGIINVAKAMVVGNAEFERYEVQFGVLLGSAEAAQQRLAELAEFGQKTPFELPEVVRADKILQGFGLHSEEAAAKFGFSGEEIRTIAGDVAAATGISFEDASLYIGKFTSGATGEAIARWQELGVLTREQLAGMGVEFSKSGQLMSPVPEAAEAVLTLMKEKYGGLMDAQSSTFEGMVSNVKDWVGNTTRELGKPIFDAAKEQLQNLLTFLNSPEAQSALTSLSESMGNFVATVMPKVVDFIETRLIPALVNIGTAAMQLAQGDIQGALSTLFGPEIAATITTIATNIKTFADTLVTFVTNNWPTIQPILAGVIAAFTAMSIISTISGFIATLTAVLAPLTAAFVAAGGGIAGVGAVLALLASPIGLVIGLIALLTAAWVGNWGGIRDTLTDVWEGTIKPALEELIDWLGVAIPQAIETLSEFWEGTLRPAMESVWNWVKSTVIPIIEDVVEWLSTNIPRAIETASEYWEGTLKPALETIWNFFNDNILPIFDTVADILERVWEIAITAAAGFWENVLQPALETIYNYFNDNILPILKDVADFVEGTLGKALLWLKDEIIIPLGNSLKSGLVSAIETVNQKLKDFKAWLDSIELPWWLTPGSPTPFENAIRGINYWFSTLVGGSMRDFINQLDELETRGDVIDGLFGFSSKLASFSGNIISRYQKKVVDPLQGQIAQVDKEIESAYQSIEDINGILENNELSGEELAMWLEKQERHILSINNLTQSRVWLEGRLAQAQQKTLEIQQKQEDLAFLKQQWEFLKMLEENKINPADILGGLELGVNANLEGLIDAMQRAMLVMIEKSKAVLGVHSDSTVFKEIGQNIMSGLASGISDTSQISYAMSNAMDNLARMGSSSNQKNVTNNLTIYSNAPTEMLSYDFSMMNAWAMG